MEAQREMTGAEKLENYVFKYHPPQPDQIEKYGRIRDAALAFALVLDECCPPSPDRTDAIRKVSEAVMVANASIARSGVSYR